MTLPSASSPSSTDVCGEGYIARTAEALHTLEENVRGPLSFVHKASSSLPRYKETTVAAGKVLEQKPALRCDLAAKVAVIYFVSASFTPNNAKRHPHQRQDFSQDAQCVSI